MNRKQIVLAVLALLVVISGLIAWKVVASQRLAAMGKLTTIVNPDDATMTIDNKKAPINKQIGVTPGDHTIAVKRSGFASQTKKFTIKKTDKLSLDFFLAANSSEGYNWLTNHPSQALRAESVTSQEGDKIAAQNSKSLPLIDELPFIDQEYRVDYGQSQAHPNDPNAIAIYIKYWTDQGKADALQWIKFKGYNPDNLEIIYTQATTAF